MTIHFDYMPSPVGELMLAADDDALHVVQFANSRHEIRPGKDWIEGSNALIGDTRAQLLAYFAGKRHRFTLPMARRGTEFQEQVWQALMEIPWGQTWSYQQIADHIGNPRACRAVGAANGRNPVSIIRPCHRVIGADGSLTGYGGGLSTKKWLLQHEGAV